MVVLLSGRVKLSSDSEEGREVVLGIREAGELIGELSAIDGGPRSATITAIDDVEALIVGGEDFKAFLAGHPRVAIVLMEVMAERLRDADRKRVEMTAGDTTARVISRLVEMARRFGEESGGRTHISLPLTQEELAAWSGSSREAVAKALATLRDRGWIETSRRAVTILDLGELEKRCV